MKWILRVRTWLRRQWLLLTTLFLLYPTLWALVFTFYSPDGLLAEPYVVCMWVALFLAAFVVSFPFGKVPVLFIAFLELGCFVVYFLGRSGPGLLHILGLIAMSISLLLLGLMLAVFSIMRYEPPWDPFSEMEAHV